MWSKNGQNFHENKWFPINENLFTYQLVFWLSMSVDLRAPHIFVSHDTQTVRRELLNYIVLIHQPGLYSKRFVQLFGLLFQYPFGSVHPILSRKPRMLSSRRIERYTLFYQMKDALNQSRRETDIINTVYLWSYKSRFCGIFCVVIVTLDASVKPKIKSKYIGENSIQMRQSKCTITVSIADSPCCDGLTPK